MICMRTGSASRVFRSDVGQLKPCTKGVQSWRGWRGGWTIQGQGNYTDSFFHKYFKVLKER